ARRGGLGKRRRYPPAHAARNSSLHPHRRGAGRSDGEKMPYIALIIPLLFAALFAFALFKKVRLYDCFTEGVKGAIPLAVSLFPYLAAVLILSELFEQSGLSQALTALIAPALNALGIPPEIAKLVLIKPF